MHSKFFTIAFMFVGAIAFPGPQKSNPAGTSAFVSPYYPSPTTSVYSPGSTGSYRRPPPGGSHPGEPCHECGGECGDSIVQTPQEECDLGPLNGKPGSGCTIDCKKCHYCGDGILDTDLGEQCDLGRMLNGEWGSGCSANCKKVSCCGDGIIEWPEECDAGSRNGQYNSGCSTDCKKCGYCGDGILDHGEICDNGIHNGEPGNDCSRNCTHVITPCHCGNGILEPGEQCDFGPRNGQPGSHCSKYCTWVECKCGNGITEYPEECDDGDMNGEPWSQCTKDCKWKEDCGCGYPEVCGNGIVEYGEECDDGYLNGSPQSNCTTECKLCDHKPPPRCGDGIVDGNEQCDDGFLNASPSSNCGADCRKKVPPPTSCATCNPNPFFNKCTITTSCINIPKTGNDYCACRAGYRAALPPTDPRQFRLNFPGQEYRVFVAPGVDCDTLCDHPFPGPDSCKEVPVQGSC